MSLFLEVQTIVTKKDKSCHGRFGALIVSLVAPTPKTLSLTVEGIRYSIDPVRLMTLTEIEFVWFAFAMTFICLQALYLF